MIASAMEEPHTCSSLAAENAAPTRARQSCIFYQYIIRVTPMMTTKVPYCAPAGQASLKPTSSPRLPGSTQQRREELQLPGP